MIASELEEEPHVAIKEHFERWAATFRIDATRHILDCRPFRAIWRAIRSAGRDLWILVYGSGYDGPTALERRFEGAVEDWFHRIGRASWWLCVIGCLAVAAVQIWSLHR